MIKGYEKDVGTKTSFYGFTAYSLVASLSALWSMGFKKIPMGKVSQAHDFSTYTQVLLCLWSQFLILTHVGQQ